MALVGSLQEFSLLQLLNQMNQGHKTGRLTIKGVDGSVRLFFQEGKLSFGVTDDRPILFRESLLRSGKLTQDLDRYIFANYQPVTEKGLALLLEASGLITRDEVVAQEAARLNDLVDLVFSWELGTFKFEPSVLPPEEVITVSLGLEGIITEGVRRQQKSSAISELVPDLDSLLQFVEGKGDRVRNLSLETDQWRVIAGIDGKSTVREIAKANGLDDLKVRKVVSVLVDAGLVELVKGESSTEPYSAPTHVDLPGAGTSSRKSIVLRLVDRIRNI